MQCSIQSAFVPCIINLYGNTDIKNNTKYVFMLHHSLYSSVVEHWSRKPGVVSSNLTGGMGIEFVQQV